MKKRNSQVETLRPHERARLLHEYQDVCHRMQVLRSRHNGEKSREFSRLRQRFNELEKKLAPGVSVSKPHTKQKAR